MKEGMNESVNDSEWIVKWQNELVNEWLNK